MDRLSGLGAGTLELVVGRARDAHGLRGGEARMVRQLGREDELQLPRSAAVDVDRDVVCHAGIGVKLSEAQ